MHRKNYYVRIKTSDTESFAKFLIERNFKFSNISVDFETSLYQLEITSEEALSLKLGFPTQGIVSIDFENQIPHHG